VTVLLEHPAVGARCTAPAGWEVVGDERAATVLALEPVRAVDAERLFRANLVLTADPTGLDFRQWQVNTDLLLPEALTDYLLLDLERLEVAGGPGGRRLARHLAPDGTDVTTEQWFTLTGGTGLTLTATVDSWRYDALADVLAAHARSLTVTPPGAAP
jgi:hypothetical protein